MADILSVAEIGAAGRPFLTFLIDQALSNRGLFTTIVIATMNHSNKAPQANNLPSVADDSAPINPAAERDALRLNMLRRIRPPPFKYAWAFYHDKHTVSSSYEGRLTLMLDNIITVKPFWEAFNRFPLEALKMKDSVHFFKRGVMPVWEDPRNMKGGSWTFRIPKALSQEFWKELLLLAVGEQFVDAIQPGDDLCGMSLSVRFNSNLITIWNRDSSNQKSIDGILAVLLAQVSTELKPKDGSYHYKKHSDHIGFNEAIAKAKEAEDAKNAKDTANDTGEIVEAEVKEDEGNKALLKDAEGESV